MSDALFKEQELMTRWKLLKIIVESVSEPYILVTGTIGFGEVPQPVQSF